MEGWAKTPEQATVRSTSTAFSSQGTQSLRVTNIPLSLCRHRPAHLYDSLCPTLEHSRKNCGRREFQLGPPARLDRRDLRGIKGRA